MYNLLDLKNKFTPRIKFAWCEFRSWVAKVKDWKIFVAIFGVIGALFWKQIDYYHEKEKAKETAQLASLKEFYEKWGLFIASISPSVESNSRIDANKIRDSLGSFRVYYISRSRNGFSHEENLFQDCISRAWDVTYQLDYELNKRQDVISSSIKLTDREKMLVEYILEDKDYISGIIDEAKNDLSNHTANIIDAIYGISSDFLGLRHSYWRSISGNTCSYVRTK